MTATHVMSATTFLDRYQHGEYLEVWDELQGYGPHVRHEPLWTDAIGVAAVTMQRVKNNLDRLVEHLTAMGYQFKHPQAILLPPSPDVHDKLAYLEHHVGALPLSLRAWYQVVGSVDLNGAFPDWDARQYPDALVVDPIERAVRDYHEWKESCKAYSKQEMGPYCLPVAPDAFYKAHGDGDTATYAIRLPSPTMDALLGDEPHHMTFVNYLRTCFKWGGFPGFEYVSNPPLHEITALTKDLTPF
ncbi:MAG TPA: hypothetical protein VFZ66_10775 [Herpetosiphonaceae bacterium]